MHVIFQIRLEVGCASRNDILFFSNLAMSFADWLILKRHHQANPTRMRAHLHPTANSAIL